jgi:hypothetical protein
LYTLPIGSIAWTFNHNIWTTRNFFHLQPISFNPASLNLNSRVATIHS